jgi:hypothetical protein
MKLTLVSVYSNGRKTTRFVMCPTVNGKTVCPANVMNDMLSVLGVQSGDTYSIGL